MQVIFHKNCLCDNLGRDIGNIRLIRFIGSISLIGKTKKASVIPMPFLIGICVGLLLCNFLLNELEYLDSVFTERYIDLTIAESDVVS